MKEKKEEKEKIKYWSTEDKKDYNRLTKEKKVMKIFYQLLAQES